MGRPVRAASATRAGFPRVGAAWRILAGVAPIALAAALPALGDASLPAREDEPPAHVIKVAERRVTMPAVELVAKKAAAPAKRALPVERLKREARADLAVPLAFVDDTIDSGDLV